mgnify:CR=1 FL=1
MPPGPADYERASANKRGLVAVAREAFRSGRNAPLSNEYDRFRAEHAGWLDDYALFMALKRAFGGGSWGSMLRLSAVDGGDGLLTLGGVVAGACVVRRAVVFGASGTG